MTPGRDRRPSPGARHRAARGRAAGASDEAAILPKKTLHELARLLADGDGDVTYERGENHCSSMSAGGCSSRA